jgi:hypothetical protein
LPSCFFVFLILFYHSILVFLYKKNRLRGFFFYRVIPISWLGSWIWQVNPDWLDLYYPDFKFVILTQVDLSHVFFFVFFYPHPSVFNWLIIELHWFFSFEKKVFFPKLSCSFFLYLIHLLCSLVSPTFSSSFTLQHCVGLRIELYNFIQFVLYSVITVSQPSHKFNRLTRVDFLFLSFFNIDFCFFNFILWYLIF